MMNQIVASVILLAALTTVVSGSEGGGEHLVFPRAFAPGEGQVAAPERGSRDERCLNGRWRFQPVALPSGWQRDHGVPPAWTMPGERWQSVAIRIPSPWNANSWGNGRAVGAGSEHPFWPDSVCFPSYPAAWDAVEMGWLNRTISVPAGWSGRRIMLHFEAVAGDCLVLVNHQRVAEHQDRFLPFDCDITDLVHPGGSDDLCVGVRHSRLSNLSDPRYPHYRWTQAPGSTLDGIVGIWQDVALVALPTLHTSALFVQPWLDRNQLAIEATVRNDGDADQEVALSGSISPWLNGSGSDVLSAPEPVWRLAAPVLAVPAQQLRVKAHSAATLTLTVTVTGQLKTWSPDAPNLYGLVVQATQGGREVDACYQRFGWRQFTISGSDLLLNGARLQIAADILHPFGVFMQSRRHAWAWFRMIKDAGGNGVRLHAQPWPSCYQDLADEMGLVVLSESGLFGSSLGLNFGAAASWPNFTAHLQGMVRRDRNHPSVFGWSMGNELFAIFDYNHLSPEDSAAAFDRLIALGRSVRDADPTRPWVSCDGDEDLHGSLPVWSKHFGHGLPLDRLPQLGKPLMVGESGGTYYATPGQLAEFNGERAYESYAGRNEALAIDVYQNIVKMARPRLAYYSASELAWFGLEHLPLGYRDHDRLPDLSDGIFFAPYAEGVPGVQPERIPPYCATLNPGLDPALPLYRPLAMFQAVKAALAKDGPQPCAWDHRPGAPAPAALGEATIGSVGFVGDHGGALHGRLANDGVPWSESTVGVGSGGPPGMLIVDGETITAAMADAAKPLVDAVLARHGIVLVSFRTSAGAASVASRLLPAPVTLTAHPATSLVRGPAHPWNAPWSLSELYFAENPANRHITSCGLDGPFVAAGAVVLRASDADWALFNNVGENAKCAAMVLYEQLAKPSGAALVVREHGGGRIAVTTIDPLPGDRQFVSCWRKLMSTMGVKLLAPQCSWYLPVAPVAPVSWRFTLSAPPSGWEKPAFDDRGWNVGAAGFGTAVPNSTVRSAWTSDDIWLRTTFSVAGPVSGPLELVVHHDEDVEVYLNGERIFSESGFITAYKTVPLPAAVLGLLTTGVNQISVHCHQTVGGQYIDVGLAKGLVLLDGAADQGHDLLLNGPRE
jgi:beta-galactosidase